MSSTSHTSHGENETYAIAATFAKTLRGGELVELEGDLGAGKTTFVRGVAQALGATVRVKSPTFTVANEYPIEHEAIKKIVHLDFYRLKNVSELQGLELENYRQPDSVMFVEWPNIFGASPFTDAVKIKIEVIDETTRQITL
jgi:tRNA threonylcarbamoyladenosine biosynthesis protein TsaE